MRDEHCIAIIAALYQHAAFVAPHVRNVPDYAEASSWAKNLLDEAKRVATLTGEEATG